MLYMHFKIEAINSILNLIVPNFLMAKIGIEDTHYSIPMATEHQKYLNFV